MNKPLDFKQAILELKKTALLRERQGFVLLLFVRYVFRCCFKGYKTLDLSRRGRLGGFIPGKFLKGAMPRHLCLQGLFRKEAICLKARL